MHVCVMSRAYLNSRPLVMIRWILFSYYSFYQTQNILLHYAKIFHNGFQKHGFTTLFFCAVMMRYLNCGSLLCCAIFYQQGLVKLSRF